MGAISSIHPSLHPLHPLRPSIHPPSHPPTSVAGSTEPWSQASPPCLITARVPLFALAQHSLTHSRNSPTHATFGALPAFSPWSGCSASLPYNPCLPLPAPARLRRLCLCLCLRLGLRLRLRPRPRLRPLPALHLRLSITPVRTESSPPSPSSPSPVELALARPVHYPIIRSTCGKSPAP